MYELRGQVPTMAGQQRHRRGVRVVRDAGAAGPAVSEGRRWEIVVPGWVPDSRLSLNGRRKRSTLRDGRGRHMPKWRETWTLEQQAKEMMWPAIWQCPTHPQSRSQMVALTLTRARVTVTFVYPIRRERDDDNGAGMAKPIVDALRDEQVIAKDDSASIELTVRNIHDPRVTETRIVVEEL